MSPSLGGQDNVPVCPSGPRIKDTGAFYKRGHQSPGEGAPQLTEQVGSQVCNLCTMSGLRLGP